MSGGFGSAQDRAVEEDYSEENIEENIESTVGITCGELILENADGSLAIDTRLVELRSDAIF